MWEAAGLHSNGTFPLDYFSYNNSALLDVIFRHLEETNFSGVTVSGRKCYVVASVGIDARLIVHGNSNSDANPFVIQGPVSFSHMGIRPVNRLQVMQYRYVTGLCMCVN